MGERERERERDRERDRERQREREGEREHTTGAVELTPGVVHLTGVGLSSSSSGR